MPSHHGLFVGLTTLDLIYQATHPPATNEKIVASDYTLAAGGPATNAAVCFAYLGNRATLLSAIGSHPVTHLLNQDLQQWNVATLDLAPQRTEPPPVSSIVVTQETGERAVVSINATKRQATVADIPAACLQGVDILLIDGHQMEVGRSLAEQAKAVEIPVVIDGGSWKPGFETILPFVDYAICSANFHPPGCPTSAETAAYLQTHGISKIAMTQGANPILYWYQGEQGQLEIPPIQPVDTLGAGDIFHGAFCGAILQNDFVPSLSIAAKIAGRSCEFFGTRSWMAADDGTTK